MPVGDPNAKPPQDVRIGSYRILEPLGSGGMSSVFRGVHVDSGHVVAVKVLTRSLAKHPQMLQRFLREAKNAEALEHPNIVAIYDRGSEQGRYYIILEYVDGGDLHERVRTSGPLPVPEVVAIAREVAGALRYAAERGVIHRDVKPANLLRTLDGRVKVTDLGLALQLEVDDERVTRDGTTVGTVDYMAPEQARDSRAATVRSDLYSLGCTLFYLLTGFPPYPGGDVADKLSRHCNEPPPDPRKRRAEIPDSLALLIIKLMAKDPDERPAGYDAFLAELERVPVEQSAASADPDVPLADVLIDEEDATDAPEDGWVPLGEPSLDSTKDGPARTPVGSGASQGDLFSMAELVALAEDEPAPTRPAAPRPGPVSLVPNRTLPDQDDDFESDEDPGPGAPSNGVVGRPSGADLSTEAWIGIGLAIGVAIALLMVGLRFALEPDRGDIEVDPGAMPEVAVAPPVPIVAAPVPPVRKDDPAPTPPEAVVPAWVEPGEDAVALPAEAPLHGGLDSELLPKWATEPSLTQVDGPSITVSRLRGDPERRTVWRIKQAFDGVLSGTIELADAGPFFEDDLRITGKDRAVRATNGVRPIVRVLGRRGDAIDLPPAAIVLDEKRLVLEGLDLVVDAGELPPGQNSLFYCRGGRLVLRDCTIHVVRRGGRPFSIIQIGERLGAASSTRVLIERTYIRGEGVSLVDWKDSEGDVALNRSVVLGGDRPLVILGAGATPADRNLFAVRSILAASGPILELGSTRGGPLVRVMSAGSTFAWFRGSGRAALIASEGGPGAGPGTIRWTGDGDTFAGWGSVLSAGRESVLADLPAARGAWDGWERLGVWNPTAWTQVPDWAPPSALQDLAPERAATLSRVASPSAFLEEKAVAAFERQSLPALADRLTSLRGSQATVTARPAMSPALDATGVQRTNQSRPDQPVGGDRGAAETLDLFFDAQAQPWFGDLGRFLGANFRPGVRRVRVTARGVGPRSTSPVRLPDGVSLEIVVLPPVQPGSEPLTWTHPLDPVPAPALLHVVDGELVMVNVHLSREGGSRPGHLVRVDRGHLVLIGCHLRASGTASEGGGGLVAVVGEGSRPLAEPSSAFATAPDRSIAVLRDCLLMTGGVALRAELGRGIVALENCALAVGQAAFDLRPQRVRCDRFEVDLQLDRCTLASEEDVVRFGEWPGAASGPARPWLVSSRSSVYLDRYDRMPRSSVLLRADPGGLARGAILWQSEGDVYDFAHFLAGADARVPNAPRPDVKRQWVGLWGSNHVRPLPGPQVGSSGSGTPWVHDRLEPGRVRPGQLELGPWARSQHLGADLDRIGVVPESTPPPRPRRRP